MLVAARVIRKRDAGTHAHFQDTPADPLGGFDRSQPAALENLAEHAVIDGRPTRVGFGDRFLVELSPHQSFIFDALVR